jgi:RNA polymerase sigma-70 factor (ECF subfamily)
MEEKSGKHQRVQALIHAAREGDDLAMGLLLQSHWEGLKSHLTGLTTDDALAEDATVITFTKAFGKLDQYNDDHAFSTWLFTIGKNTLIDLQKKKDPLQGSVSIGWSEELGWNFDDVDDQKDPEDQVIHEERLIWLQDVIRELPENYAELVRLRYLEEMSYAEIAQALEMPLGTVKVRLFRAHGLLKEVIQRSAF